jgi:hypothetical protein
VVEVAVVERERVELRQLGASQSTGSQLPAFRVRVRVWRVWDVGGQCVDALTSPAQSSRALRHVPRSLSEPNDPVPCSSLEPPLCGAAGVCSKHDMR